MSFLSPCVLPLVPGYLSAVTGVSAVELERAPVRKVLGPSLLFMASFSAIFIALGLTATSLGGTLNENRDLFEKVSGGLIVVMGVFLMSALFGDQAQPRMAGGRPDDPSRPRGAAGGRCGLRGGLDAVRRPDPGGDPRRRGAHGVHRAGALLLVFYSAGLAIPFLLTAVAFSTMTEAFAVVKRHYPLIMATGGAVLIVMGVLIWTGELFQLNIEAQRFLDGLGLNFFNDV